MKNKSMASECIFSVDEAKIKSIFAPFVTRTISVDDPEWIDNIQLHERTWRQARFRKMLHTIAYFGRSRHAANVSEGWENKWRNVDIQKFPELNKKKIQPYTWRHFVYYADPLGYRRVLQLLLATTFEKIEVASVLDFGCGNGLHLFALATRFPEVFFSGIELTMQGIQTANQIRDQRKLSDSIISFAPLGVKSPIAHQKVGLVRGNGAIMPFANGSFDLVYSVAVLEQMKPIALQALAEIARVSKRYVLFIEPWREFDTSGRYRNYVKSKNYFDYSIKELEKLGFSILSMSEDFPQKPYYKYGFVLAEKIL